MFNDTLFKFVFIALLSGLTIIRLFYKVRQGVLIESPFGKEPWHIILLRYLIGLPLFGAVIGVIFFPAAFSWMYVVLPAWLRAAGAALGISGLVLLALAHHALDGYFSMTLILRKNHQLVRHGPYRWIRHPMYVAYFLFFCGQFLVTRNWVIGISGLGVILTLMTARLKNEEAILERHFKQEFLEYAADTPRFFPRFLNRAKSHNRTRRIKLQSEEVYRK